MRQRWQTISGIWDDNKSSTNRLNLLGQLDYIHKLSSQLEWVDDPKGRVYTKSGEPTAALVDNDSVVIDHLLHWIACGSLEEAHYLLAIVNSGVLSAAARRFMSRGQFGARDLHKHLWKLPVPEFDEENALHVAISDVGRKASEGATVRLGEFNEERNRVTVNIARRELRTWLRESEEGRAVELAVSELL